VEFRSPHDVSAYQGSSLPFVSALIALKRSSRRSTPAGPHLARMVAAANEEEALGLALVAELRCWRAAASGARLRGGPEGRPAVMRRPDGPEAAPRTAAGRVADFGLGGRGSGKAAAEVNWMAAEATDGRRGFDASLLGAREGTAGAVLLSAASDLHQ